MNIYALFVEDGIYLFIWQWAAVMDLYEGTCYITQTRDQFRKERM